MAKGRRSGGWMDGRMDGLERRDETRRGERGRNV